MTEPSYKAIRRFSRYALDVRAKLFATETGQETTVRTLDISLGGIGVVSPVVLPESSTFTIRLELPTVSGELVTKAQLRNRSGFRYGCEFIGLSEADCELLRRFQRRWGIASKDTYAGQ